MRIVAGRVGTGKTQFVINDLWSELQMGRTCALVQTSLNQTQVMKRIVEGCFINGNQRIKDLETSPKSDENEVEELLAPLVPLGNENLAFTLVCDKPEAPDQFLPLFGGLCARLGGSSATRPLVAVDVLQDLPWFDNVSSSDSFKRYLELFAQIEKNAGVEIMVALQVLHFAGVADEAPEVIADRIRAMYPNAPVDRVTICLDSYADKFGRRRVKSQEVVL